MMHHFMMAKMRFRIFFAVASFVCHRGSNVCFTSEVVILSTGRSPICLYTYRFRIECYSLVAFEFFQLGCVSVMNDLAACSNVGIVLGESVASPFPSRAFT